MSELDYNYIGNLVSLARSGSSDAFAELYAATYQKQYLFAYSYLKDEYLAQDALQETYITALKNLATLKDPKVFVAWLNQINFRVCYAMADKQARYNMEMEAFREPGTENRDSLEESPQDRVVRIDSSEYLLQQVMALPYTESQVIFLHYYKDIKIDEIAYMLELSRSTVKRNLASGKKRLKKILTGTEVKQHGSAAVTAPAE